MARREDNLKKGDGFDTHPERINRKGRPKKLPELDKLMADVLGEEKDGVTAAEAILKKLRQMAASGNLRAAEILLNRGYGMPKQRMEHTGADGAPIETIIRFVDDSKDADNINQEDV